MSKKLIIELLILSRAYLNRYGALKGSAQHENRKTTKKHKVKAHKQLMDKPN
jgi:hypothetical protein